MPRANDFPDIDAVNQVQTLTFDFGRRYLPEGVTLQGTPTVTFAVVSGEDADFADRVKSKSIGAAPPPKGTGRDLCAVLIQVGGLVAGVTYMPKAVCNRSDGDVAELWSHVYCRAPA
jgi:hypothetical protein